MTSILRSLRSKVYSSLSGIQANLEMDSGARWQRVEEGGKGGEKIRRATVL